MSLGGQTAINLAGPLKERGVRIIGTDCDAIYRAEKTEIFGKLVKELDIPQPAGEAVTSIDEGLKTASRIGYPVFGKAELLVLG